MMADVGGIENVNGRRIATPLAPPSPGSTPMMTPNRMPIIISKTLYQLSATAKPPISEAISSTVASLSRPFPGCGGLPGAGSDAQAPPSVWYTMCQLT